MKIVDYDVVGTSGYEHTAMKVRQRLKEGWQPIGGIAAQESPRMYFQAMVKYAPIHDPLDASTKAVLDEIETLKNTLPL